MESGMFTENAASSIKQNNRAKRNASIELLRTLFMFGICMIHAGNAGSYFLRPWWSIWGVSVTGFVFLTGYFGVSFKISRVIKLYAIAFYTSILWAAASMWTATDWSVMGIMASAWRRMMSGCWFLHAYSFMLFFTPLIDAIIPGNSKDEKSARDMIIKSAPILFFSYVWAGGLIHIFRHLAPTSEFVNFPAMQFLGIYAAARLFRALNLERLFTWRRFGVSATILYALIMFNPVKNATIANTLFAASLVACFHRFKLSDATGRVLAFLSPSLFAIYLIHTNSIGFGFISRAQEWLIGAHDIPMALAFIMIACVVFVVSLILDMPRRLMCYLSQSFLKWFCNSMDILFMWPFEQMARVVTIKGS